MDPYWEEFSRTTWRARAVRAKADEEGFTHEEQAAAHFGESCLLGEAARGLGTNYLELKHHTPGPLGMAVRVIEDSFMEGIREHRADWVLQAADEMDDWVLEYKRQAPGGAD
jgi:hypothetical protein